MGYDHKEELEKAEKEINESKGITNTEEKESEETLNETITLSNEKEITFYFSKLTGKSIVKIREEFRKSKRKSKDVVIEELDDMYYILVAEKVSDYPRDYYLGLKYKDYALVKRTVRDFLNED
ncbi:MAG: hypothetical protein KGV57_01125 [Fusobacterium sp.]|nr:hypothetical protein [Fusobacterium sp.]